MVAGNVAFLNKSPNLAHKALQERDNERTISATENTARYISKSTIFLSKGHPEESKIAPTVSRIVKTIDSLGSTRSKPQPPPKSKRFVHDSPIQRKPTYETLHKSHIVSVYGVEVPISVHTLYQRIKDELKILSAAKRLHLDELESVRIMEAELAARMRQLRLGNASRDGLNHKIGERMRVLDQERAKLSAHDQTKSSQIAHTRYSPQVARRSNIQHQFDPLYGSLFSNSSHVNNPRSSNTSTQFYTSMLSKRPANVGEFRSPTRLSTARSMQQLDISPAPTPSRKESFFYHSSTALEYPPSDTEPLLRNEPLQRTRFHSVSSLPYDDDYRSSNTGHNFRWPDDAEWEFNEKKNVRQKEDRLRIIQGEIEKRRRHLETDTFRPQPQYDHDQTQCRLPYQYQGGYTLVGGGQGKMSDVDRRHHQQLLDRVQLTNSDGIVKPLDYQINPKNYYVQQHYSPEDPCGYRLATEQMPTGHEPCWRVKSEPKAYSARDYLVHKTTPDSSRKVVHASRFSAIETVSCPPRSRSTYPSAQSFVGDIADSVVNPCPPEFNDIQMICSGDSGVSSSRTMSDLHGFRPAVSYDPLDSYSLTTSRGIFPEHNTARSVSSASEGTSTPSMYHLDDITNRTRNLIDDVTGHQRILSDDVASRTRSRLSGSLSQPLSEDVDISFQDEGKFI